MHKFIEQKARTFVVQNPVAGQRESQDVQEIIESRLRQQNIEYEIYKTTGQESIREVVEQAVKRGCRLILACGGDGTVSAAASGVVGKEALFGIIPAGTWNTLARNLDIPLDIGSAVDLVFGGYYSVRTIDVLEVDGKYFVLNVSVGTGSLIMRTIEREDIRRLGRLTFFWKGLMQTLGYPPHRFRLNYDGKASSFRASEVIIANSAAVGIKSMRLDMRIHLDDGKLGICRIQATSLLDYAAIGLSMLTGKQRKEPRLTCWQATDSVRVESNERLPVQADGEMIGYLPVTVSLRPQALHVIIPTKPVE